MRIVFRQLYFDGEYSVMGQGPKVHNDFKAFFAQYFYRDEGFAPPERVGLTEGIRVTVCP